MFIADKAQTETQLTAKNNNNKENHLDILALIRFSIIYSSEHLNVDVGCVPSI